MMTRHLPPGRFDSDPGKPRNGAARNPVPLLMELLDCSLVLQADWEALPQCTRDELIGYDERSLLLTKLVEHGLLTEYQCVRIEAGKIFGLILGNYRVLDRVGAGGMGVVFRGEHLRLRRQVAIKVLAASLERCPAVLVRFDSEMQTIARLQHPNIVAAIDAGFVPAPTPETANLHYFVMEYVPGQDLEQYVQTNGALTTFQACDIAYQVASALAETHKHQLVHRDLKPSNILRTPEGRVKLLDFGLAQHFLNRMTEPGTMLGTVDYMAPEQAQDASTVDIRADIYGLGGTLFCCLTGRPPFSDDCNTMQGLIRRHTQPPPSIRRWQPGLPAALDAVVARMMAPRAEDRYPNPEAVMAALLPFLQTELGPNLQLAMMEERIEPRTVGAARNGDARLTYRILVADDDPSIRQLCRFALKAEDLQCDEARDGPEVLTVTGAQPYDMLLLDVQMPGMSGLKVCQQLREKPPAPHLKVLMFSGNSTADEMAQVLSAGADDYLTKPFSVGQLRARVRAALRLKDAQDRTDLLNRHLLAVNQQLEQNLGALDSDLVLMRDALVQALTQLVLCRDIESKAHLERLKHYCRCLAEEMARQSSFASQIDATFIRTLECCVPLHDIGKAGLPEHILLKPGKLDENERLLMQTHTLIGSGLVKDVFDQQPCSSLAFLQMASDICRHHHERFDGKGYPDGLAGSNIPLAARIVALADVYDALRSFRIYKPSLGHPVALQMMKRSSGQFDPSLLRVFERCHQQFERIFSELSN
jgi:response regulator RpfG family c-di-GMP phosphodiesterase/serine/threonine protein kinase